MSRQNVAGFLTPMCVVARGGIEPPTQGFSVSRFILYFSLIINAFWYFSIK
jgi:hypothetical protein